MQSDLEVTDISQYQETQWNQYTHAAQLLFSIYAVEDTSLAMGPLRMRSLSHLH